MNVGLNYDAFTKRKVLRCRRHYSLKSRSYQLANRSAGTYLVNQYCACRLEELLSRVQQRFERIFCIGLIDKH